MQDERLTNEEYDNTGITPSEEADTAEAVEDTESEATGDSICDFAESDLPLEYDDDDIDDIPDADIDLFDALAIDDDNDTGIRESLEEREEYASFLADYGKIMAERLEGISLNTDTENTDSDSEPEVKAPTEDIVTESEMLEHEEEIVSDDTTNEPSVMLISPTQDDKDVEDDETDDYGDGLDIEFHSEIVRKSRRINVENYISLAKEKPEPEVIDGEQISIYSDESDAGSHESDGSVREIHILSDSEDEAPRRYPRPSEIMRNGEIEKKTAARDQNDKKEDHRDAEARPRIIDYFFDAAEMLVITLVAAIVITSIFFRFSVVDGHSMNNTLSDKDSILISNLFYSPDYGDIVVIEYEDEYKGTIPLVKRVIGLEGDVIRVEILAEGLICNVYRNGELLDESEYDICIDGPVPYSLAGEWTVGDGEVFVMGDHRNDSKDSREIGPMSENAIIGRAILRVYPFNTFGTLK